MNKNTVKNLALILLLAVTIFSMLRYLSELKERYRLADSLALSQDKVATLTQEKQNLLQEIKKEKEINEQLALKNTHLKDYLKAAKIRLTRLFQDNSKTKNELEELDAKFAVLKAENRALIDSHKRLYVEKEEFRMKLNSVVELKKAMKELKSKRRKVSARKIEGNRGFIIKDGQSTSSEKIIIEVIPAPYKSLRDSTGPAQYRSLRDYTGPAPKNAPHYTGPAQTKE